MNLENGRASLAPKKSKYYPQKIYHAMFAALIDSELPAKLRMTVALLASVADQAQPAKPIFVEQGTLAKWTGRDLRTIQRHIAALVVDGWIIKTGQGRVGLIERRGRPFKSGRYAGCDIVLTARAIAALGLGGDDKMSYGHTGSEKEQKTLTGFSSKGQLQAGSVDKSTDNPTPLPDDLAWLHTEAGISVPGVRKLMRIANEHDFRQPHERSGRRLSDLLTVLGRQSFREVLHDPARLYGAIAFFAKRDTDYTFAAIAARAQVQQQAAVDAVDDYRDRLAGQVLATRDGSMTYVIDADFRYAEEYSSKGSRSMPLENKKLAARLVAQWRAGELVPVDLGEFA